jgi:hypothetical protein
MRRCSAPTGSTVGASEGGAPPETARALGFALHSALSARTSTTIECGQRRRLKQRTHCRFLAATSFLLASLRCRFAFISERRVARSADVGSPSLVYVPAPLIDDRSNLRWTVDSSGGYRQVLHQQAPAQSRCTEAPSAPANRSSIARSGTRIRRPSLIWRSSPRLIRRYPWARLIPRSMDASSTVRTRRRGVSPRERPAESIMTYRDGRFAAAP